MVHVKGRFVYQRDDNQWIGVDGMTVRVYDEDWGSDEHLGTTVTLPDGSFAIDVTCSETLPDLYCELETSSSAVTVEDGTWDVNYLWTTHLETDFAGSTLNYGTFSTADASLRQCLHLYTNLVRAWRFWKNTMGTTVPAPSAEWPSSDWPHYNWWTNTLHIPGTVKGEDFGWESDTHIHEYGHHIMNHFMWTGSTDYDNGVCNNLNGDPGHCKWCAETDVDAVMEGWSNWYADIVTRSYETDYGLKSNHLRGQENLPSSCKDSNGAPCNCDPNLTEGYFGALFRDLEDNNVAETDPNGGSGGMDALALGAKAAIQIMEDNQIESPNDLIQVLHLHYPPLSSAAMQSALWRTLRNTGYLVPDNQPPGIAGGLHSTDHGINDPSPDGTISMAWVDAYDDFSGVMGYAINVSANGDPPALIPTATNGNTWTSSNLPPGTYYVTMKSVDWAGNWSQDFAIAGPYVIREPWPADFGPGHKPGWDDDVIARSDANGDTTSCKIPALLTGNSDTWFFLSGKNHGESSPQYIDAFDLDLDGVEIDNVWISQYNLPPGEYTWYKSGQPFTIPGGRHTVAARQDGGEFNAEPDETDNLYGRQYVWSPLNLPKDANLTRPAPPRKDGGWDTFEVPIGYKKFYNCDGLSYTHAVGPRGGSYGWCAVSGFSVSAFDDIDLTLHPHSTGSEDGFADGIAWSQRGPGQLDAVFTNNWALPTGRMDVGVVNADHGDQPYTARFVTPTNAAVGDSFTVSFGSAEMLELLDLHALAANNGKIAVEVHVSPNQGPIYTLWLDPSLAYGGMTDYAAKMGTDSTGSSILTLTSVIDSHHGIVLYRNPINGTAPISFTVHIYKKLGDPKPAAPKGWHAALTPRSAADGAAGSVPPPQTLFGDGPSTWFNVAVANASDVFLSSVYAQISLDHTVFGGPWLFGIAANDTGKAINQLPQVVQGGRHVVSMTLDPNHVTPELSRENDSFGEQWVWAPAIQELGLPKWRRGTNGGKTAGWELVDPSEVLDYDCEGLRTPAFLAGQPYHWAGVAVTPRPGSDVDLRLHLPTAQANQGFAEPLETSTWGPGLTDYVLVQFPKAPYQSYDAGVVRSSDDTASYVSQVVTSVHHSQSSGTLGPYALTADRVLDLHEFDLPIGSYTIRLVNLAGTVDWGLAVHGGERPYQSRLAGMDLDSRWANGPGQDEIISLHVYSPGTYCVAVWKNGADDVPKAGAYQLQITVASMAGVGDGATPARTRLAGAAPNPFRPGTELAFELARGGDARLEVFDIRGARVRTLVSGRIEAGTHHLKWNGTDDHGRPVADGVYMVRLEAGETRDVLRVVRIR